MNLRDRLQCLHPRQADASSRATQTRGALSPLFGMGRISVDEEGDDRVESSSGNLSSGIQASLPGRYATALFDIAREAKTIEAVEASLANVRAPLTAHPILHALSPARWSAGETRQRRSPQPPPRCRSIR